MISKTKREQKASLIHAFEIPYDDRDPPIPIDSIRDSS
jgi:hypothetical protein